MSFPSKQIVLGISELSKEKFAPIKNRFMKLKPAGGLWASPYWSDNEYVSSWHEWCSSEMPKWVSNDTVVLDIKDTAKVYTINSKKDLRNLIKIVGGITRKYITVDGKSINFEEASKVYDVIYLSKRGQERTYFELYGWDCESTLILNWECIKTWEYKKLNLV